MCIFNTGNPTVTNPQLLSLLSKSHHGGLLTGENVLVSHHNHHLHHEWSQHLTSAEQTQWCTSLLRREHCQHTSSQTIYHLCPCLSLCLCIYLWMYLWRAKFISWKFFWVKIFALSSWCKVLFSSSERGLPANELDNQKSAAFSHLRKQGSLKAICESCFNFKKTYI